MYSLSNALLETLWPKLTKGKQLLTTYIQSHQHTHLDLEELLKILHDEEKPPASLLPNTGVGEPMETLLSSIFVSTPFEYGTRCSSIYLVDNNQHVTFAERTHLPDGPHPILT